MEKTGESRRIPFVLCQHGLFDRVDTWNFNGGEQTFRDAAGWTSRSCGGVDLRKKSGMDDRSKMAGTTPKQVTTQSAKIPGQSGQNLSEFVQPDKRNGVVERVDAGGFE